MKSNTGLLIKILIFSPLILLLLCIFDLVFRSVDKKICLNKVADSLNIQPNYQSIEKYIEESLKPTMTRTEVETMLKNLGKLKITNYENAEFDTSDIFIKMCSHPLNSLEIIIYYSKDGKYKHLNFPND